MLAKTLSAKSFLAQIILGIAFFILFSFKLMSHIHGWAEIWGIIFFILTLILTYLFFISSAFFKSPGIPLWFFLIWMLAFSEIALNFQISICLFFTSAIFWRLLAAERNPENKNYAFDIGIMLSIAGFFYPPAVFLAGFLIFNYLYMQSVNIRVMVLFLLGFALPLALGIQILYLIDELSWLKTVQSSFCLDYWQNHIWSIIPIILLIVISWIDHLSHASTQDINKRYFYFLAFLYFINWIVILGLFAGEKTSYLAVLGLPISLFLGRFTQYQKTEWVKEFFLWGFLAFVAVFYFRNEILMVYDDLLGNVSF